MHVARLHGPRDVRLGREAVPVPVPGEALIRITTVGLCGSDLHWFETGRIGTTELADPLVLGHEAAGVVAVGPRRGERVVLEPAAPCGMCAPCRSGRAWLCSSARFAGHTPQDGALREFMAWPADLLVPLPDAIEDPEAALLEPLGVALHALDLAGVDATTRAGVVGCGPVGLLIVRALRAAGVVEIAACDPLANRLAAADASGATAFDGADGAGLFEIDVAFEASGEPDAVTTALRVVRPGGTVVLVGIAADDRTVLSASLARRKELTLVFARRMTAMDLPRAIRLVVGGQVDLGGLITHRFGLDDVALAFAALESRAGLKIVVEP